MDFSNLVEELTTEGVRLVATEEPIFQDDACRKMMLSLLSVFAEFESNIRKERQMEGIELAKTRGVYRGRQKSIDRDRFKQLHDEGMRKCDISRTMGISRQSVYQLEKELTLPLGGSSTHHHRTHQTTCGCLSPPAPATHSHRGVIG